MKVVLDTNVFISGIFWTGTSNKILNSWKEGKFSLISSIDTISEITRVLSDFKIRLPDKDIQEIVELVVRNSEIVEPKEKIDIIKDDQSDNALIEAAVAGNAHYIVSQDNHLLKLRSFRNIKILSPEEFNDL